jgi:hypothetical protein
VACNIFSGYENDVILQRFQGVMSKAVVKHLCVICVVGSGRDMFPQTHDKLLRYVKCSISAIVTVNFFTGRILSRFPRFHFR